MSTNSSIAIAHNDGTIQEIYCHFDGYLSNNGRILFDNYNSLDAAKSLIEQGACRSLEESIEECEFYSRDCGEDYESNEARTLTADEYTSQIMYSHYYCFVNGQWVYRSIDTNGTFVPLAKALFVKDLDKQSTLTGSAISPYDVEVSELKVESVEEL